MTTDDNSLPLSADAKKIRALVKLYCIEERHPTLPWFKTWGLFERQQAAKFPAAEKAGCYVIYGSNKDYRYVGESSNIGNRFQSHFSRGTQLSTFWMSGTPAQFVDLIEVFQPWERFSLEQYITFHMKRTGASS